MNASMTQGITLSDQQMSFILLNALPTSWQSIAGTILASSTATTPLTPQDLVQRFVNEESRISSPGNSAALTKVAPIKKSYLPKGTSPPYGGQSSSEVTCFYCKKAGHKANECNKKKKDLENAKKGKQGQKKKQHSGSAPQSSNTHVAATLVNGSGSIQEVSAPRVSLYAQSDHICNTNPHWMLDSGATSHSTPHINDFTTYTQHQGVEVEIGDGSIIRSAGIGTILLRSNRGYDLELSNVLDIPDTKSRILSTGKLADKDVIIINDKQSFSLRYKETTIAEGYRRPGGLYWLPLHETQNSAEASTPASASLDIWHLRMGHLSKRALKQNAPKAVNGLNIDSSPVEEKPCHGCELGKSSHLPFPSSSKRASSPLEIVHSDLVGPLQCKSIQGNTYFATFLDDFSKTVVVIFLKAKSEFKHAFEIYKAWAEKQLNAQMKCLHSDRGGEYVNKDLRAILDASGIEHMLTMPHSPQQNGRAERFNRTIMEKGTSMLHHAGLSLGFWQVAVEAAVHIYNCTPSRSNNWRTPLERWDSTIPDVSYFRVFGCKAYYHVPEGNQRKLDPKAREAVFVGYEPHSKGYRLWDSRSHSFVSSRDVTFDEGTFPSRTAVAKQSKDNISPLQKVLPSDQVVFNGDSSQPPPAPATMPQAPAQGQPTQQADSSDSEPSTPPNNPLYQTPDQSIYQTPRSQPLEPSSPPRRTRNLRTRRNDLPSFPVTQPSFRWNISPRANRRDSAIAEDLELDLPVAPRRSGRTRRPNPRYNIEDFDLDFEQGSSRLGVTQLLNAAGVPYRDPYTFKEAMSSVDAEAWLEVCQYELDALAKLKVWTLTDLPKGHKVVKNKWVFKKKADGRFRARLVAKGFTQIEGVDFDETFSPVARFESLRLLLALAALEDWEIHQMDVKSVFLHGVLDEEIYMEQPQGFITPRTETKVCRLKKAIYGLKQASRAWNLQFHGVLISLGFKRMHADAGIYVCHQHGGVGLLVVVLYVDDITIMGSSLEDVRQLKSSLSSRYEMTDLGEIQSYLGMRISRDRSQKRLEIDQSGYIKDVLDRFGMADANPHPTPLPAGADAHLVKFSTQAASADIKHYQSLIGSLLYVQIGTRPDISFAVSRLVQYAANPSPQHLRLAKYVLAYLSGMSDLRLCYDGANGDGLHGYSDSSLADQTDDRHSTSGYVYILMNGAISWSSRKQKTVAQNTTEAEYMAMTDAANQAAWYRSFLAELGYTVDDPIPLHGDNKGAIDLALNPVTGRRSKHIDIRHHVIREYIENGYISLVRTPTEEMVADGFTKSLPCAPFRQLNADMGLINA